MNKNIIPQLWFNKKALDAAEFYVSLFENSSLLDSSPIQGTSSSDAKIVGFILDGVQFEAVSAGPYFNFNTSISLLVHCDSDKEIENLWSQLNKGAIIHRKLDIDNRDLMYGCLQDRYGLVWRLVTSDEIVSQKITPCLLFSNDAQKAMIYYENIFEDSVIKFIDQKQGNHMVYADITIDDLELTCIDVKEEENPGFTEAFSFVIKCENQVDVNYYWSRLSHEPEAEQAGWLKDKFGLSWQIIPRSLDKKLMIGSIEQREAVIKESLDMKKIKIKEINKVYKENK